MDIAHKPAHRDIAHNVFDRGESRAGVGLVTHRQKHAADDLDHQHENRQRAEVIPEIEVFRGVVFGQMLAHRAAIRQPRVDPIGESHSRQPGELSGLRILAHDHFARSGVMVRRDNQVGRRRAAAIHAASVIETRSVAGAEKPFRPRLPGRGSAARLIRRVVANGTRRLDRRAVAVSPRVDPIGESHSRQPGELSGLRILAHDHFARSGVMVRRDNQVGRRRAAAIHAASVIETRSVAGAEKPFRPRLPGRAAKMRA